MTDPIRIPTRRFAPSSLRPLAGIDEALFVHSPHTQVDAVSRLCSSEALGAVYTLPKKGDRLEAVGATLRRHRSVAPSGSLLLDANLYSGKNRKMADEGLDLAWAQQQLDAGAPWALTDSGFIDRNSDDNFRALMTDGAEVAANAGGPVLLAIPIEYLWVKERADMVRDLIDATGVPYALMLGHGTDPLSSAGAVRGLLHILNSPVPGTLLRADLSALGAVAGGAAFGAVGTSSSLRHIWPPRSGGSGVRYVSALLPQGMSYHRLETMALAAGLTPDALHWRCDYCDLCQGGRLDKFVLSAEDAFVHSISGILGLGRDILDGQTIADNLKSFKAHAVNAQFVHSDIEFGTEISSWRSPESLNAWVSALA